MRRSPGGVEVSVPATSANLGPGFDCLGVALAVYLRVRFSFSERSEITGKGRIRTVDDSLIYRSFRKAFEHSGAEAPSVGIHVIEDYPSARGLGASASAIVAGLAGANSLGQLNLQTDDLARLAVQIEGHSDNVLPALLGGVVLSLGPNWMRFDPSSRLSPFILVARSGFKTEAARKTLPKTVSQTDAVANASAAAALLSILTGGSDPSNLLAATQDRLHEPFRLPLMPESLELHKSLRERGIATALSGAGPSLICLVEAGRLGESSALAEAIAPEGWQILRPAWDLAGARVQI